MIAKNKQLKLLLATLLILTMIPTHIFANATRAEDVSETVATKTLEELSALITFAQNRHTNSAEPGIHVTVGRHPATARNTFQIAIDDATAVMMAPNLTETEITTAYHTLNEAIETFMNTMIDPGNAQNPNGFLRPYWREIARGEDELQKRHLRATWISTVVNIDWPSIEARGTTPAHVDLQMAELRTRFDEMASMNMNAVIFQTGPTADAFYRSEIVPWSAWLTGETNFRGNLYNSEGVLFDPLAYAIELAHERNMELHAWLNPYRVSHVPPSYTTRGGVPVVLSSSGRPLDEYQAAGYDVLQLIRDEWTRDFPGSAFDRFGDEVRIGENRYVLNPAIPDGRAWIVERVLEVIQNYDVDAIQFDDYFYPSDYFDDDSFLIFNTPEFNLISGGVHTDHAAWRRENTEMMIIEVAEAIRTNAPWVKFGISPVGVWRSGDGSTGYDGGGYSTGGLMQGTGSTSTTSFNNYDSVFADTRRWVIENKIDYLTPQIYWDWNLPAAPYGPIADWWGRLAHDFGPNGTKRNSQGGYMTTHIYLGMGLYRMDLDEFDLDANGFINGRREWTNTPETEFEGERTWMRQEHYNIGNPYILGSMIFTQNQMRDYKDNGLPEVMETLRTTAWRQPALVPAMPHLGGIAPRNPVNVRIDADTISWSDGETSTSELIRTRYFVIYRSMAYPVNINDANNIVAKVPAFRDQVDYRFTLPGEIGDYYYVITAVNRVHDESDPEFVLISDAYAPVIVNIDGNEVVLSDVSTPLQGPVITFTSNITSQTNGVREIRAILNIDGTDHDISNVVRRQGTLLNTNITLVHRFAPDVIVSQLPVTLTLTVTDGADLETSASVNLTVTAPEAPTLTTTTLASGNFHMDYSATLLMSSAHPVTWTISEGALPTGLTLNHRGVISGRPTEYGEFTFTVRIENAYGGYDERALTLTIDAPEAPTITTEALPNGALDILYNAILTATTSHPLIWTIIEGELPDGLTLTEATGTITGIPTTLGNFTFEVQAENPYGGSDSRVFSILIEEEPEPRVEPRAYRFIDFEDGEARFVNTNWVTSGSYNNRVDVVTVDVQTEPNADDDSRVFAGTHALHWEIRDSGQPASSLSGQVPMTLPQRDGENPTGIGFWLRITGNLSPLWGDRPVRMGLINGGYKWWNVPVETTRVNEWQWVEVQFANQAWNAGNVNFDYDPNLPLIIPGPGTGNANAFLWLRKLTDNLMEADIYIDHITLLYGGITGAEANFDSSPPIIELTEESGIFNLTVTDMESGLNRERLEILVNGEDVAEQALFSPRELVATLTLDGFLLEEGENEVTITAWDNFGFVASVTETIEFVDQLACQVVETGRFDNGEVAGSVWRICSDGTLEIDEGAINWTGALSPWHAHRGLITQIEITGPIRAGASLRALFRELTEVEQINGLTYFDTTATTSMYRMFFGLSGVTELDVTNFATNDVTNMALMFRDASSLVELDVSGFDTSNVTDMREMFRGTSIEVLDLSGFDTSSVTNMNHMFTALHTLRELTLGESFSFIGTPNLVPIRQTESDTGLWQGEGVALTSAQLMSQFDGNTMAGTFVRQTWTEADPEVCYIVARGRFANGTHIGGAQWHLCDDGTLEIGSGFINWTLVTSPWHDYRADITEIVFTGEVLAGPSLRSLFHDLHNLEEIHNLVYLDTSQTTNMARMFRGASSLTDLDLSSFDTTSVTDMSWMFFGASGLETLDVTNFATNNVTNMGLMFRETSSLTELDVTNFNTSNVTDMREMFRGMSSLTTLDLGGFDTGNVTNMNHMFVGMTSLRELILGDLFTPIGSPGIPRLN